MIEKNKNIFSKLVIGKKKKKITLDLILKEQDLIFLNFLWKEGYIFGYVKINNNCYRIFFKKRYKGFNLVTKHTFVKKKVLNSEIKELKKSELYETHLLKTSKGVMKDVECIKKGVGGIVFIKL